MPSIPPLSPTTSTTLNNSMSLPLSLSGRPDRPPPALPSARRRPPSFVLPAHRPNTRIRWKEALVLFSALSPGVLETLARNGRIAGLGRSVCFVLGRCVVFLVFLNFLTLGQDSRPLYCILTVLCCYEVVAFSSLCRHL